MAQRVSLGLLCKGVEDFASDADQGNAGAQTILGWMYANGYGVPQDYGQAVAWFRKSKSRRPALQERCPASNSTSRMITSL